MNFRLSNGIAPVAALLLLLAKAKAQEEVRVASFEELKAAVEGTTAAKVIMTSDIKMPYDSTLQLNRSIELRGECGEMGMVEKCVLDADKGSLWIKAKVQPDDEIVVSSIHFLNARPNAQQDLGQGEDKNAGITVKGGTANFTDCVFESVRAYAGAITNLHYWWHPADGKAYPTNLNFKNCHFKNNYGHWGGAIRHGFGMLTVEDCEFERNFGANGGVFNCWGGAPLAPDVSKHLEEFRLESDPRVETGALHNKASQPAGDNYEEMLPADFAAKYENTPTDFETTCTIRNSFFKDNWAINAGGIFAVTSGGTVLFEGNTLEGNTASSPSAQVGASLDKTLNGPPSSEFYQDNGLGGLNTVHVKDTTINGKPWYCLTYGAFAMTNPPNPDFDTVMTIDGSDCADTQEFNPVPMIMGPSLEGACACKADEVATPKGPVYGCAFHYDYTNSFCYVHQPKHCPYATFSTYIDGEAWVRCDPNVDKTGADKQPVDGPADLEPAPEPANGTEPAPNAEEPTANPVDSFSSAFVPSIAGITSLIVLGAAAFTLGW